MVLAAMLKQTSKKVCALECVTFVADSKGHRCHWWAIELDAQDAQDAQESRPSVVELDILSLGVLESSSLGRSAPSKASTSLAESSGC